jgi:hypothetical protein
MCLHTFIAKKHLSVVAVDNRRDNMIFLAKLGATNYMMYGILLEELVGVAGIRQPPPQPPSAYSGNFSFHVCLGGWGVRVSGIGMKVVWIISSPGPI